MKNNLEYYHHKVDSHNHWKFKTLRREYSKEFPSSDRYGWAGDGKFWALNNLIAESEGSLLDLSHDLKKTAIAADLDFTAQEFDIFLDILINRCHLVRCDGKFLTTKRVQQVYETLQEIREKERIRKKDYRQKQENVPRKHNDVPRDIFPMSHTDNPPSPTGQSESPVGQQPMSHRDFEQSKVKESKYKYSDTKVSPPDGVPNDPQKEEKKVEIKPAENPADLVAKRKKKIAQKKKGRNPDSEPHWHLLRRVWVDFNKKHLHFSVEPMPKADYSSMHRIIETLRERAIGQGVLWTEQEAIVRWEKFLSTAYCDCDKWLTGHFEMKNLESQMQSIFKIVENGRSETHITANTSTKRSSTSDSKIRALANWTIPVPPSNQKGKD